MTGVRVPVPGALLELERCPLGPTEWVNIDAERIAAFGAATGDDDATFLALSLVNLFLPDLIAVESFSAGVNVGLESMQMDGPLVAGSRIRGEGNLVSAAEVGGGVQIVVRVSVRDESGRAVCVVDTVSRFFA